MTTPAQALAWELWSRHHRRLLILAGILLGFALLYPVLCSQASLDLSHNNDLESLGEQIAPITGRGTLSLLTIVRVLYLLALACGPTVTMIVTLLFVAWMFTFTMVDPQTKDPMKFPSRLFNLPVSTGYIFAWLVVVGQLAVVALYCCWHYFVRMPKLGMFGLYNDGFAWMSLLAITQGITWAMASWPKTRMLILAGIVGLVFSPTWRGYKGAEFVLPALLVLGLCLGYVGLRKMRRGEWQGVDWERLFSMLTGRGTMRGPRQFTSPAQAQLWFEWRRFARTLCLYVVGLTVLPVVILILIRFIFRLDPFPGDTISGLASYLIGVPVVIHLFFGISPGFTNQLSFVLDRPQTNGRIVMTILKAVGIFTAISWLLACLSLLALRLLGNFAPPEGNFLTILVKYRPLIALGLIVLSWRFAVANLYLLQPDRKRLRVFALGHVICAYFSPIALYLLSIHQEYWNAFCRVLPFMLILLIAVKMALAGLAFRNALHRRLLSPSEMIGYVSVWALIVAATAIPILFMLHGQSWALPLVLCAILLAPLARIGFTPITLAWQRHQ